MDDPFEYLSQPNGRFERPGSYGHRRSANRYLAPPEEPSRRPDQSYGYLPPRQGQESAERSPGTPLNTPGVNNLYPVPARLLRYQSDAVPTPKSYLTPSAAPSYSTARLVPVGGSSEDESRRLATLTGNPNPNAFRNPVTGVAAHQRAALLAYGQPGTIYNNDSRYAIPGGGTMHASNGQLYGVTGAPINEVPTFADAATAQAAVARQSLLNDQAAGTERDSTGKVTGYRRPLL